MIFCKIEKYIKEYHYVIVMVTKSIIIHSKVEPDFYDKIIELRKLEDRSISFLIRQSLKEYIEKRKK